MCACLVVVVLACSDLLMVCWICLMCILFSCFFFFQAEDGIRDLVRSRGLGDVYKRQEPYQQLILGEGFTVSIDQAVDVATLADPDNGVIAVSYTHLTLPTSDLV